MYTPTKGRNRNVNFRSLFTTKDALKTTVAFIRCLVYLIVHGKRVDKVYSDDGPEFKGIFKQFCENPMGLIEQHPVLKTAFTNAQKFFGFLKKGQEIRPIEWILFNPQTGSDRRTAIVERFNRTLKGKLERLDLEYNESTASGKSWEQFMGAVLFAYNYGTTHRSLFELMNHNAPVVKTLRGIAHRRTGDKPYVYTKRSWIHPHRPKQFRNIGDKLLGIENRIRDISPGSIDAYEKKEAVIVALKRKQDKQLRDYYNQRPATSFPDDGGDIVVQTRKLKKAGYEGHLDDLFGKQQNDKSQTVLVKRRR